MGTCGQLAFDADGTQWTPNALQRNLDQSLLLPGFFGTAPPPPPPQYVEFDMSKLQVLHPGDSGQAVRNWQGLLIARGYGYMIAPVPGTTVEAGAGVDGEFGPKTEAATEAFKAAKGITEAGAGEKAWTAALAG
jgi:peptidoglycan hydrolase-like protein with peptidoglycan-binding domain